MWRFVGKGGAGAPPRNLAAPCPLPLPPCTAPTLRPAPCTLHPAPCSCFPSETHPPPPPAPRLGAHTSVANPQKNTQWYPLARLAADLGRCCRALDEGALPGAIVNLFPEPLATRDIVAALFPDQLRLCVGRNDGGGGGGGGGGAEGEGEGEDADYWFVDAVRTRAGHLWAGESGAHPHYRLDRRTCLAELSRFVQEQGHSGHVAVAAAAAQSKSKL